MTPDLSPAISKHFWLSPTTVRNHLSRIFAKLHATDRADAIVRAREAGLGTRRATGPQPSSATAERSGGSHDPV